MNCAEVKSKLSAFQDNELPEDEMNDIEQHLRDCDACSNVFEELDNVWQLLSRVETIESAPYFWTRLSQRLRNRKLHPERRKIWFEPAPKFAISLVTTMILFLGLMIGFYLGQNIYRHSEATATTIVAEETDQTLSLSSFDDFPQESVADVYVTLLSENNH